MREMFSGDNQGEGNRDAARRYDQHVQKQARSGESKQAADRARKDLDGRKAEEPRDAERQGTRRIAEEDPEFEGLLNGNVVRGID
jgi:hypothetical protein